MQKPLLALALLAPAIASAGIAVAATSTTTAFMTKDASVVLDPASLGIDEYDLYGGLYQTDPAGEYTMTTERSILHSFDGSTFVLDADAQASVDAPDFSAVQNEGTAQASYGTNYHFALENTSSVEQTVHFDMTLVRNAQASASPYADAPDGGAYGEFEMYGGVGDFDAGEIDDRDTFRDTFNDGSPTSLVRTFTYGHDFAFAPGESRTIYVYAASRAFADYTPVPEPTPLAALALGGQALLRRRKHLG